MEDVTRPASFTGTAHSKQARPRPVLGTLNKRAPPEISLRTPTMWTAFTMLALAFSPLPQHLPAVARPISQPAVTMAGWNDPYESVRGTNAKQVRPKQVATSEFDKQMEAVNANNNKMIAIGTLATFVLSGGILVALANSV